MIHRRSFLKHIAVLPFLAPMASADMLELILSSSDSECHASVSEMPMLPIFLSPSELRIAKGLHGRLRRIQSTVGYGNFNVLGLDDAISVARRYSNVGEFTVAEMTLFEQLFYFDASEYGFYGEKVILDMTSQLNTAEMFKVPRTGHFLYKGEAMVHYDRIRKSVGGSIVLTSGVRSVIKQMYLFLNKALSLEGNLSLASTSLAPAGYSYHGIGDFDVGKVGYGYRNFTRDFETTDEFKRLMDLGFVAIRYPESNPFGVRYEPWHIKVV